MGLFSKKDYVCEKCGKTFTKRFNTNGNLCDECKKKEENERIALEKTIQGYISYGLGILGKMYSPDEMRQIIGHRDQILNKYKNDVGISRAELKNAGDNYKNLSDQEAAEVIVRAVNSTITATLGAAYTTNFFVPTSYEGVIIDVKDVFAVAFTTGFKLDVGSSEAILCAVFTNDPYIPVFPMVYVAKTGFFEVTKSKKGRADVASMFEAMCPNLSYPVVDIKELKKRIKNAGVVRGNIDMKFMMDQISNASSNLGIFDTKNMFSNLYPESVQMLDNIGYIPEDDIGVLLHMDKMFNRNFWNKQINKLSKMI